MSRKRAESKRAQSEGILLCARDLFTEHGFEDVTVSEVAAAAGVARATVFNHFGSKAGLVDALRDLTMSAYRVMLEKALADATTPVPTLLRALFHQMGQGIEGDRRFYRGVFREMAKVQFGYEEGGAGEHANEAAQGLLAALLRVGQERGEIRADLSAESLVLALTSLVNGVITYWLYTDASVPLHSRMDDAIEAVLGPVAVGDHHRRGDPLPNLRAGDRPTREEGPSGSGSEPISGEGG